MAKPLHVALGVLAGVTGGPATYGRRLCAALATLPNAPRITVLTDAPAAFAAIDCEVVDLPMRGGIDRLRWQHVALPRALRRVECDVYHDVKNALPWRLPVPAVVTVHDLAYHRVPETFGRLSRLFLRRATRDACRRARIVVVPSAATQRDVAAIHPAASHKLRVVLHGIDAARTVTDAASDAWFAQRKLPARFVLHVGTIQARKNVDLLVRAVRELRDAGLPHRVVLAGRRGWLSERAFAEIERDDTALWLGEVDDDELAMLYARADAFCSPSAYEGFGFTVADALAAGTPVAILDRSSLPEVCGDAAVRFGEPTVAAIRDALGALLRDGELRARLAAAGPLRAAQFSWRTAAERTLAAYREAAAMR